MLKNVAYQVRHQQNMRGGCSRRKRGFKQSEGGRKINSLNLTKEGRDAKKLAGSGFTQDEKIKEGTNAVGK